MLSDSELLIRIVAVAGLVLAAALFALFVFAEWSNPYWSTVSFDHFAATIGLPGAAAAAFIIVALFRTTEGQIKLEALGFKFEGAAGPIVMWVMCFLAITIAIKLLWPLTLKG
ncbi:hypothetical protein JQ581_00050 [Bradyrhizobium liaoningense]|uniref:hypothetical protein n=1 Tax=Bradyrhizobium liaoningense TaxID=43992 RepID=UPI001BA7009D|nr:hypothetical protein [Bradyrhizobium liaoningense]MBR0735302.1 hypothetical protein [Bradyrhizobium liaoningense]